MIFKLDTGCTVFLRGDQIMAPSDGAQLSEAELELVKTSTPWLKDCAVVRHGLHQNRYGVSACLMCELHVEYIDSVRSH